MSSILIILLNNYGWTTPVLTRHYIGGQYEIDAQSNIERLYLGGDAYSAPAVYIKEGVNWKIYYICRDYLGSITHIAYDNGSLKDDGGDNRRVYRRFIGRRR